MPNYTLEFKRNLVSVGAIEKKYIKIQPPGRDGVRLSSAPDDLEGRGKVATSLERNLEKIFAPPQFPQRKRQYCSTKTLKKYCDIAQEKVSLNLYLKSCQMLKAISPSLIINWTLPNA